MLQIAEKKETASQGPLAGVIFNQSDIRFIGSFGRVYD
jgi:hypothetical protein